MPDRPPRRERRRRGDDGVRVNAVMAVEIRDGAGLAEMLHAERAGAVSMHGAEPSERCGMAVKHRHNAAMGGDVGEEPLDMRAGMNETALSRALRRGPTGIEPVGGSNREETDVAAIL